MGHVPESPAAAELLQWVAYERDAAWTAKLAILRARRIEDIAHFGACLREHDRHADELAQLARLTSPGCEAPVEPTFVTKEPFIVGAIDAERALVDAMERLERMRIDRYEQRSRGGVGQPATLADGLLERHQADARARLASLQRLRESRCGAAA
jgi:hypothetical protein